MGIQIIPEMRKPRFSDQLLTGLQNASETGSQMYANQLMANRQAEMFKKLGIPGEVASLPQDIQKEFVKSHFGGKAQKFHEKENSLQVGLETVNKMRSLLSSAGPSNWFGSLFGGEVTRDRAELEALGRSLIPLVASGVPIRNQKEFEEYRKVITNPNSRQAELEGALNGLQDLFERSLMQSESFEQNQERQFSRGKKRFNQNNPEHKAKAEQLFATYKNKDKVRQILEREFEF